MGFNVGVRGDSALKLRRTRGVKRGGRGGTQATHTHTGNVHANVAPTL